MLGVFLREPLLDWQKEARSLRSSSAAYASLKVGLAKQRLAGRHPSDVTVAELEAKHATKSHWRALVAIVEGDAKHNERARLPHTGLHTSAADSEAAKPRRVEQQGTGLLDLATAPTILGRTWAGWKPWL